LPVALSATVGSVGAKGLLVQIPNFLCRCDF
jgi:hypothetical protein